MGIFKNRDPDFLKAPVMHHSPGSVKIGRPEVRSVQPGGDISVFEPSWLVIATGIRMLLWNWAQQTADDIRLRLDLPCLESPVSGKTKPMPGWKRVSPKASRGWSQPKITLNEKSLFLETDVIRRQKKKRLCRKKDAAVFMYLA